MKVSLAHKPTLALVIGLMVDHKLKGGVMLSYFGRRVFRMRRVSM